jgi:hypothetical protein
MKKIMKKERKKTIKKNKKLLKLRPDFGVFFPR